MQSLSLPKLVLTLGPRYCFGGAVAIRTGSMDIFDSVVIAHPGNCSIEQIKAIKVPACWVCAEGMYRLRKT
jgi:dienelactone hydrolase